MGTRHPAQDMRIGVTPSSVLGRVACAFLFVLSMVLWTGAGVAWAENRGAAQGVAHYIMGVNQELLGDEKSALREYEKSVGHDGAVFATRLKLGTSYARLGNYRGAINELNAAARLNPQDIQSHYFLALIFATLHDLPKAVGEYEVILRKLAANDPRNTEIYMYLGQLYHGIDRPDQALEQFEKVLALNPKDTRALYLVSSYYLDHKRRDEGIALLKRCLAEDPLDDGCLNSLSYTYAEQGENLKEALAMVKQALEIRPDNAAYIDTLGWVYYRQGQYAEALKELLRAVDLVPDPVIYDHLGDVAVKIIGQEAARTYWTQSLELDPAQVDVRAKLDSVTVPPVADKPKN